MVGVKGLEPSTSRSQTARASQLRHTPKPGALSCTDFIIAQIDEKVYAFGATMSIWRTSRLTGSASDSSNVYTNTCPNGISTFAMSASDI